MQTTPGPAHAAWQASQTQMLLLFHTSATASSYTCQFPYIPILQFEVMVTAGANQAFTNVVLTLLDSQDKVVLFKPYYFNHLMAVQMTGGADNVVYGRYSKLPLQHSYMPRRPFAMTVTSVLIHAFARHVTSMQNQMS